MPLYRNYEPGDWVLCEVDARSHHKVICQMETEDRLDGVRFIRHAMPEDFRLYQCRFVGYGGVVKNEHCPCVRFLNLKYGPAVFGSMDESDPRWEPVDYTGLVSDWAIEGFEILARGLPICRRDHDLHMLSDRDDAIVLNAIAHVPALIVALQAVASATSKKQKDAAFKRVKDVLRSLDIIK